jgi:hypothetical protein
MPVIEIVMHLLGQLFIVQRPQVKFITAHNGLLRKRAETGIGPVLPLTPELPLSVRDIGRLDSDLVFPFR